MSKYIYIRETDLIIYRCDEVAFDDKWILVKNKGETVVKWSLKYYGCKEMDGYFGQKVLI